MKTLEKREEDPQQSLNKEYDNLFIEYCEDNGYEVEDLEEEINDESDPDGSVLMTVPTTPRVDSCASPSPPLAASVFP